jgi:hypothetical protein
MMWRRWLPMVLLCAVGGSRWVLSEALPGSSSTFASAALGCGSTAAIWLLVFPLRMRGLTREGEVWRSAVGGALMIAGPMIGLLRPSGVSGTSLAMALTPVVLAVAETAMRGGSGNLPGRLWPGLAAIAGLLLVLPEPSLASPASDLLLVLAPVLTGCGAALFCTAKETAWRLPLALLGAAVVLMGCALGVVVEHERVWPAMLGLAAGVDALEAVLTVLVLGRLSAARWSAQFALVPLLVLLEGLGLMRERVPVRVVGGLVLLALAGLALLLPPAEEARLELGQDQMGPAD